MQAHPRALLPLFLNSMVLDVMMRVDLLILIKDVIGRLNISLIIPLTI